MVRLTGPLAALQFLTRIPVRLRSAPSLAAAVVWFPTVGALIGAAVGGVAAGAWHLVAPVVASGLGVITGLLITGAFHEDGLADVADAFGGGWTVELRPEILKDPRHGTYGVAALCASIVIRVLALGSMPGPAAMFAASVAAHAMARGTAVVLMAAVPLSTHQGLGADYGRSTTWRTATIAGCSAVAIAVLSVGWWIGPLVLACAVSAVAVGWLARRKIGGISGDVLGACEQVAECAALIVSSGLALHHSLWWA